MSRMSACCYIVIVILIFIFCVQCSSLYVDSQISKIDRRNLSDPPPCPSLNVSALRLITFDLFGALMLTRSSLQSHIAELLPSLSSSDVERFTDTWLEAYVSYFGKSFPRSQTRQPFLWVIHSSLLQILESFKLSTIVPEDGSTFKSLIKAWSNLQPRPGTVEVLSKLSQKYQLGLLSNGDKDTLQTALRVFPSSVNISSIFSSDYPINCFKTCSAMYAQVLEAVHGDKTQVFHVAGSAYDTHGARTFGIFSGAIDSSAKHTSPPPCFAFDDIRQLISFFNV
ncbi:unnamed protein product [Adineta ricciae]|uniref:Uncharacterized protein n=1 Tax=Adineta ricciae TaxID=249248 RepID=A0A814XAE0_ADIRI|nr:unnamed protein product [Adineta ricciae]CAF1215194.1 unnamed protein product [Adineta ricciae]